MLRAGLRGQAWARVWEGEIRKRGISYTVDTVREWSKRFSAGTLYWILGSDQWKLLPSWKNPDELRKHLHFLVFPRPDRPRPRRGFRMSEILSRYDISATEIRHRLRQALPIDGMVAPGVEKLIRQKGWYR